MFKDRVDAGRLLARALEKYTGQDVVVLGIPRGGVIVAAEVAAALDAPLDLVIPRKIGAPGNQELAIGAVAGEGMVFLNAGLIATLGVSEDFIEAETKKQVREIDRRRRLYLGEAIAVDLGNKITLIVDDGLATGYTALAAAKAVKALEPKRTVLAIPVAPAETLAKLKGEVDELVCLSVPEPFFAVGQFYEEFHQVTDGEVVSKLRQLRAAS